MLNDEEWKEFEKLCDGEYMAQVEDAGFEAALYGVKLAISILEKDENNDLALAYIGIVGNIRNVPVSNTVRRKLYVNNYGEEEVQALEEVNEIPYRKE